MLTMLNEHEVKEVFRLAGFEVLNCLKIANHDDIIRADPWFLVKTEHGVIVFGSLRTVYSINWELTDFRGIITDDSDITNMDRLVHCYNFTKLAEYLSSLKQAMSKNISKEKEDVGGQTPNWHSSKWIT